MFLPRYVILSGLITLSAMVQADPLVPRDTPPQPAVVTTPQPVVPTQTAPSAHPAMLPPYSHFIPPVLEQYAKQAQTAGNSGTAHILNARAQRLLGKPVNASAKNPSTSLASVKTTPTPSLTLPTINPGSVPPLWSVPHPATPSTTPAVDAPSTKPPSPTPK